MKLCASFQIHWWLQTGVTVLKCSIRVKIGDFFVPYDLDIWRMTLKNNRAPLLYYVELCASFQIHWWSQTWVTAWKRSSRVKIGDFLSCMTLRIDVWPWKTLGHLSYVCFNLCASFHSQWWIQTGVTVQKRPIWVKINDFFLAMWPWNLTDDLEEQ